MAQYFATPPQRPSADSPVASTDPIPPPFATQTLQRQRLEHLGVLACGAAHELKNLLSPLLLSAEMALQDIPPEHPAHVSIVTIIGAAQRTREMVQRFGTYGSLHVATPEWIQLEALTAEVVSLVHPTLRARAHIRQLPARGLPRIFADRIQTQQVITNLLLNAADALHPTGGEIELALDTQDLTGNAPSGALLAAAGPHVRLSVKDNGVGIDAAVLPRIFDNFYTTKIASGGTGLGLAIIRRIMTECGGGLAVESHPGRGSTFHVYWPSAVAGAEA